MICTKNNFGFIDNSNIESKHLNDSGLHLNELGTSQLANNVLEIIKI